MMKWGSLIILLLLTLSCSRPFDEIPKNAAKASPKQVLMARLVEPATFIGRLARPVERSSPVIAGDTLYVGSVHGTFLAIRHETGRVIWKRAIEGGVESSPVTFDGKVYFGANDGYFYCLSGETGNLEWKYLINAEVLSAPLIKGGLIYFVTSKNEVYALKAKTGEWVWFHNQGYAQKLSVRGTSTPIYNDGKVYVGFSDGLFVAFNAFTGKVDWERKLSTEEKFTDVDSTPVLGKGALFVGTSDGHIYALKSENGETVWKQTYEGILGLATDSDRLYVGTLTGKVLALERGTGNKIWEYLISQGVPTAMTLVEDQLIFGSSSDYVYSLQVNSGSEIWRYNTDSGITAQPLFAQDKVYLFTEFSSLHIIDPFYLLTDSL